MKTESQWVNNNIYICRQTEEMLLLKFRACNPPVTCKVFYNFLKHLPFGLRLLILALLFELWQTSQVWSFPPTGLKAGRYSAQAQCNLVRLQLCIRQPIGPKSTDVTTQPPTESLRHRNTSGTNRMPSQRCPCDSCHGKSSFEFL